MPRNPGGVELGVLQAGNLDSGNSLVASAVRYASGTGRVYRPAAAWQDEAWRHYDICSELRYAANWIGNVLSRATLHAATKADGLVAEVLAGPAYIAMQELFGGEQGQSQMLSSVGIHLTIAGECFIVGRQPRADRDEAPGPDIWEVVGTTEMKHRGQRWAIDYGDGNKQVELNADEVVLRMWRSHPRRRIEADSAVRALLPVLSELEFTNRHIMAQVTSRLTGAGITIMPQSVTFPSPPIGSGLGENANNAEKFMFTLGEAMIAAVANPGSPESIVPIVITVPDDAVDKIKQLTFWTPLDEHALAIRADSIRRLALGLDMPPEILLGTASVNHWGGWQIEEASIKSHIEPLLELITAALSVGYMQPAIGDQFLVAYNTSVLRMRKNRSAEAVELYDRGELSGEGLRRETGFDPADAPADEEFKRWMLRKVASGNTAPEQVAAALRALGVIDIQTPYAAPGTDQARPAPSLEGHPYEGPPAEPGLPQVASLYAVSEALVYRALERVGNRLRSLRQVQTTCSAADTYLMLAPKPGELDRLTADLWTCVPTVLKDLPVLQQQIVAHALDSYIRALLVDRRPHDSDLMRAYINGVPMRKLEES